jgi:dCTP deaminase
MDLRTPCSKTRFREHNRLILSRADILSYIEQNRLRFEPRITPDRVAQVSVDLLLGRKFTTFRDPPAYLPAINVDHSLWDSADLWEHTETDVFRLRPNHFVLAHTQERICIPDDLVGLVEGRSSWARVGISIHVTAPKIDPGFDATITLEMFNFGKIPVELRAGIDKPAQLMLLRTTTPLKEQELYGHGEHDRFQGQDSPIPHKEDKK